MSEWTRNTPWRQGHLLTDEAINALGLTLSEYSNNNVVAIVATHDCDLAQPSAKEPHIEVVVGRRISALDGNNTHAKSSRTLHIGFEGNEPLLAEFVITEKRNVPKKVLVDFAPAAIARLSPPDIATFQLWLASRYRRSAFPDEFEDRLIKTKLSNKIAKAVRPHGKMITAVYFDVDEGQEVVHTDLNDVYLLDIILLHAVEPDFHVAETATKKAKEAIEQAFANKLLNKQSGKWESIELRYVDVMSEEALTYHQSKLLKKWRLDHISLGAIPQQFILTE